MRLHRRRYLARIAGVTSLGLAGCSGSPTEEPTPTPTGEPTPTEEPTPTPTRGPTPTEEPTPTPTGEPTPTPTPRPAVDAEITVGPEDDLYSFAPSPAEVPVGGTVRWTWDTSGHNVKPTDIPSGSGWEGTPGGDRDIFDAGHTYTHTFEVEGRYDYVCVIHQTAGMTGTLVVG